MPRSSLQIQIPTLCRYPDEALRTSWWRNTERATTTNRAEQSWVRICNSVYFMKKLVINTNEPLILLLSVPERIIEGRQRTTTAPSRTITYNTGFLTQFRWVLKRTFRNLLLNPQTSVAQVSTGVT